MVNFQNKVWEAHRGLHGTPKDQKMAKIDLKLDFFFYFATIYITQVKHFCYCYKDLMWRD